MPVVQRTDSKETFSFAIDGRERYVQVMVNAGYVEMAAFEGKESKVGYWCESCKYYKQDKDSVTGAWCWKFNFPDKGFGCCGGWTALTQVQKVQDSLV